jgi:hypothetical protein
MTDWKKEFRKYAKPKVFCGIDHCSGMWNLRCDDVLHNDGRELITVSRAEAYIDQLLTKNEQEARVRMFNELWDASVGITEDDVMAASLLVAKLNDIGKDLKGLKSATFKPARPQEEDK